MADKLTGIGDKSEERITREINRLRDTNKGVIEEFEQMGGSLDLTMARIEHLAGTLKKLGVITEMEYLTEQRDWEKHLRPQVIAARDARRHEVAAVKSEVEQARRKSAHGAPVAKGGLLLPRGVKRPE